MHSGSSDGGAVIGSICGGVALLALGLILLLSLKRRKTQGLSQMENAEQDSGGGFEASITTEDEITLLSQYQ
jgi:MYXO-CTERM domain-containing protein